MQSMKTILISSRQTAFLAAVIALQTLPAAAMVFTNNTTIAVVNTNFDNADIVVTNCTLTIDGPHPFASIQIQNGGALTHSSAPNGILTNQYIVTGEPHTLSLTNADPLFYSNVLPSTILVQDALRTITYTNGADYEVLQSNSLCSIQLLPGSAIADGTTNLVDYTYQSNISSGLNLAVTGDVIVQPGGSINADFKGYGAGLGPGAGNSSGSPLSGGGASHGGNGGLNAGISSISAAYDSIQQPVGIGSGGGTGFAGSGGTGGGAVNLVVAGTLRNDGLISANGGDGTNGRSGGGSGGSVWLAANAFAGAGAISANGGNGEPTKGGGGGGGRIALIYSQNNFSGQISARGGSGYGAGGAGTIYTRTSTQTAGQVLVDNGGLSGSTTLPATSEAFDLTIQAGASLTPPAFQTLGNLLIASNAWLTMKNQSLTVTGNATLQAGGHIIADGAGYAVNQGSGAGHYTLNPPIYVGGGGSYGGFGAAPTSATYGTFSEPVDLGSGGGSYYTTGAGGAGGGSVRLSVTGTLVVNGIISARGADGIGDGGGGGSGGSIWLTTGTLAGAGSIAADGGAGSGFGLYAGGGGGGGRIAVKYNVNLFFGALSAHGGGGSAIGGAGTIYTGANNQSSGQMLVDNAGQSGANTAWTYGSTIDLTITGGASVLLPGYQSIGNLFITSNAWLVMSNQTSPITISGNATIQSGGGILADGTGYGSGQGPGPGRTSGSGLGSGGGYGGSGGSSASTAGGTSYGYLSTPSDLGSGGGSYYSGGGAGGGSIRLSMKGTLDLDGVISANGAPGTTSGSGGGSGGTISLTVGTLSGSGLLSANGGSGNGLGGGGGGGRIAIVSSAISFSGRMSAYGGGGYAWGGAGTIFIRPSNQTPGQVILDNAGQIGANTPLDTFGVSSSDLTVRAGANASFSSGQTVGTLVVGSGSWLSLSNQFLTVNANATIQSGGAILADGAGNPGGAGTGAGRSGYSGNTYVGGGGGYGGSGGSGSSPSANGGITFGSATSPTDLGSGGGSSGSPVGGTGGGVIHLSVSGLLQVDGRLSANGNAPTNSGGGGGSGGSIFLSAGTFAGSGIISANGGQGSGNLGGGGGGGRIAITYGSTVFSGAISAIGGGGYVSGGAGTIYTKANSTSTGQILVDNGGSPGAATSWPPLVGSADLTVRGGAIMLVSSSLTAGNLLLASNAWIIISNQVSIVVTANATIRAGSGILADGTAPNSGSGAGRNYYTSTNGYIGGGGGYGGYGGTGAGAPSLLGGSTYGSATSPIDYGSSGGGSIALASPGGSAIQLNITGTLLLDGRISANGASSTNSINGGGSGGSVWLTTGTLTGAGSISANGGSGGAKLGGGGGGGRIAVQYTNSDFTGRISAYGGGGYASGGAGTIYTKAKSQSTGQMLIDNGGQSGTNTTILTASGLYDLTIKGGAVFSPSSTLTVGNLLIASNGWMQVPSQTGNLQATGSATVQAGGGIVADGAAPTSGQGTGGYSSSGSGPVGGGGGHGGYGSPGAGLGATGGASYDSITSPATTGSSGGFSPPTFAGRGGGLIRLTVVGPLIADGRISADGTPGLAPGAGAGSGGTVFLTVGTLSGAGVISANGGAGNGLGGGGGGGRIALYYGANSFSGRLSAYGGAGTIGSGGAGTIYTKANTQTTVLVLVDNGGPPATNTPIAGISTPFDLTVRNGATVSPTTSYLALSNLLVDTGGCFTTLRTTPNLSLAIYGNATIQTGAVFTLDAKGYLAGSGPGAGISSNFIGSGAGYGGTGGASALFSPGGAVYGSAQQPTDLGSGGGMGYGVPAGSEGGGAVSLRVGGDLTINGQLTANGDAALQDGAGGSSGGSVWVNANTLVGAGLIAANGGDGEPTSGGGGGGGRIAIYAAHNYFRGNLSVIGGDGYFPGQPGTVFSSATLAPLVVTAQSPTDTLTSPVGSITLTFNTELLSQTVLASDAVLTTPAGVQSNITVALASPTTLLLSFPVQTAEGLYTLTFGPHLQNIYGLPMSQVYTGAFTIVWPTISGTITDTNNLPVSNVNIQSDTGVASTSTDTNGNYALKVTPGADVTITPFSTNLVFVPSSRFYPAISASSPNQNYLAIASIAPAVSTVSSQATNMVMNWYGLQGVTYQTLCSTNLVDWQSYADPLLGTNGPIQLSIPLGNSPMMFFRIRASD
jgi:hypothetical protein